MIKSLAGTKLFKQAHASMVFTRRVQQLALALADQIPAGAGQVLDVGCGDGTVALSVSDLRPELTFTGIDVFERHNAKIPVIVFDGQHMPFKDKSYDTVLFVDVLHHTTNMAQLLREARRVARHAVVVKDHISNNWLDEKTLRFMDWVGNAGHGVSLPYNYLSYSEWTQLFSECDLEVTFSNKDLALYAPPFGMIFDRELHFVKTLSVV